MVTINRRGIGSEIKESALECVTKECPVCGLTLTDSPNAFQHARFCPRCEALRIFISPPSDDLSSTRKISQQEHPLFPLPRGEDSRWRRGILALLILAIGTPMLLLLWAYRDTRQEVRRLRNELRRREEEAKDSLLSKKELQKRVETILSMRDLTARALALETLLRESKQEAPLYAQIAHAWVEARLAESRLAFRQERSRLEERIAELRTELDRLTEELLCESRQRRDLETILCSYQSEMEAWHRRWKEEESLLQKARKQVEQELEEKNHRLLGWERKEREWDEGHKALRKKLDALQQELTLARSQQEKLLARMHAEKRPSLESPKIIVIRPPVSPSLSIRYEYHTLSPSFFCQPLWDGSGLGWIPRTWEHGRVSWERSHRRGCSLFRHSPVFTPCQGMGRR